MENHYLNLNKAKSYLNNSTLLTKSIQTIIKEEDNCNVNDNNNKNSEVISVSSVSLYLAYWNPIIYIQKGY